MPHTTVEFSSDLGSVFDTAGFAEDLHPTIASIADASVEGCKTRFLHPGFVDTDYLHIADGSPRHAMIHVEIALLSGRTTDVKRELGQAVLALVRTHTAPAPAFRIQMSVEIRELDRETYATHVEPVRDASPQDAPVRDDA
ncbi:5-carboxymethyl-2-hydroxymuconate Delta-isomerase [Streptomyces sp.]|uniref:5-carboxymethyl-2-hydroxymuconate Delta-isomerase n=1 Tax=Streptomyces sp. TaxID=1931 RepID=UPI002F3FF589